MLYGLAGASGVGKTTLAKRITEDLGITFMQTSITECAKRHGFNAIDNLSLEKRIQLQMHLLEDHVEMIAEAPRPLITDRTPIDFIAYMLAEVGMHSHKSASSEVLRGIHEYKNLCLQVARIYYDVIFILEPLDTYETSPTRPAENHAYHAHTQLIMRGAIAEATGSVSGAVIPNADIETRVLMVSRLIADRMKDLSDMRETSAHVH